MQKVEGMEPKILSKISKPPVKTSPNGWHSKSNQNNGSNDINFVTLSNFSEAGKRGTIRKHWQLNQGGKILWRKRKI